MRLNKEQYIAVTSNILKSFPDFIYTRSGAIAYKGSPTVVSWTAIVQGTHTGAPYSPLPGVPAVVAKDPPVRCQNDPESITVTFKGRPSEGLTQIQTLSVEAKPGGKGLSGPVGFYLQAGGDPSKLKSP